VVERLEDEDAGAIGHHEAVSIRVEGSRRLLGRVVALRGEGTHGGEGGDRDLTDPRLGAPGDHHVGVAAADDVERVADGVVAAAAGAHRRVVRPARIGVDRHEPGAHVRDERGHQERTNPLNAQVVRLDHVPDHGVDATDPRADDHAGSLGQRLVDDRVGDTGVGQRLDRCGPGEVHVPIVAADLLLGHHQLGLEVPHLPGDLRVKARRVE